MLLPPCTRARSANLRIANKRLPGMLLLNTPRRLSKRALVNTQLRLSIKLAPKHTASSHAPKHTAKKAPSKHPVVHSATRSVHVTRTVSHPHPVRSASQECAPSEACDDVVSGGSQLIRLAMEHLGANPTGWSHNWCGRFLAMTLEAAGHRGGGNLAAGYADYGLPAKTQVGAIAVMPHHVGIVTAVGPNYVVLLSGNHAHKVGVGRYASNKIIAYRMAA